MFISLRKLNEGTQGINSFWYMKSQNWSTNLKCVDKNLEKQEKSRTDNRELKIE